MNRSLQSLFLALFIYFPSVAYCQSDPKVLFEAIRQAIPSQLDKADSLARELLLLGEQFDSGSDSIVAISNYMLGVIQHYNNKNYLSEQYYRSCLSTQYAADNNQFRERCWNNLGIILDKMNRMPEAKEAYLESLKITEQLKDSVSSAHTWINLSLLDFRMGNEKSAIDLCKKALSRMELANDTINIGTCHQNLAIFYGKLGDPAQEDKHNQIALSYFSTIDQPFYTAKILTSIASVFSSRNQFSHSEQYLDQALKLSLKNGLDQITMSNYLIRADNAMKTGVNLSEVPNYLNLAMQLAENGGDFQSMELVQLGFAKYYARTGKYNQFEDALQNFIDNFQRVRSKESLEVYNELEIFYKLSDLQREKSDLLNLARQKSLQFWSLFVFTLVLIALLGVIVFQHRVLRQNLKTLYSINVSLTKTNQLISKTEETSISENENDLGKDEIMGEKVLELLYRRIVLKIEQDRLFLDPNFSLLELSEKLNRTPRYLSQAINTIGGKNFSRLLNEMRVNEARKIIAVRGREVSMNEIAKEAGFTSRVSFNRQFKEITGFTPSAYLDWSISFSEKDSLTELD